MNRNRLKRRGNGFTLVELLVVVAILAILIALVVSGVMAALGPTRGPVIAIETGNLDAAMRLFKTLEGSDIGYPPDGTDGPNAITAYLQRLFPRRDVASDTPKGIDISTGDRIDADLADIGPSEALYFWLGGFGENESLPLSDSNRGTPGFDFDELRLTDADGDGWLEYSPKYCQGTPYIYFASRTYDAAVYSQHNGGMAKPYRSDVALVQFANERSFQIIAAGQDGDFGAGGGSYPSGAGYTTADHDNITNFSEGTLADKMP